MSPFIRSGLVAAALLVTGSAFAGTVPTSSAPVITPAPANSGGIYLSADGGAYFVNDNIFNGLGNLSSETGWGFNVAIGAAVAEHVNLEIQSGYYQADFSGNLGAFAVDGEIETIPVMANIRFDIPVSSRFGFELGLGAGAIRTSADLTVSGLGLSGDGNAADWDLGAQALAGVNFKVTDNTAITLGYRFLFADTAGESTLSHFVGAGLRVSF
jgi:opacity protein-like surface antigen